MDEEVHGFRSCLMDSVQWSRESVTLSLTGYGFIGKGVSDNDAYSYSLRPGHDGVVSISFDPIYFAISEDFEDDLVMGSDAVSMPEHENSDAYNTALIEIQSLLRKRSLWAFSINATEKYCRFVTEKKPVVQLVTCN